jgi:outer membrane biosynthesis protein TonB
VPTPIEPVRATAPSQPDALPLKLSRELSAVPVTPPVERATQQSVAATETAKTPVETKPPRAENVQSPAVVAAQEPPPIAVERVAKSTFAIPAATPTPDENAKQESARADAARVEEERKEAARIEAAKLEVAKLETQRQEAQKLEAARAESARAEATRLEAARVEAVRVEAARAEAARQAAQRIEAQRLEAARLEAQRLDAQRQEAARVAAAQLEAQKLDAARAEAARTAAARAEAMRRETEKQEALRQAAAQAEAARLQEQKDEDARREARRRNMARILEEEAQQRDSAKFASSKPILPLSLSSARRVRLWGRADPNEELVKYAENWARRIQLNTLPDTVKQIAGRKHVNPMVTVAVRSDGTIETVTLVVSSGVPEIDEAIRRIVQSHAPYLPFPSDLARDYDVIEIRRTWVFDVAVRLQ